MIKLLNNFLTYQSQASEPRLSLPRCEVVHQLAQTLQKHSKEQTLVCLSPNCRGKFLSQTWG